MAFPSFLRASSRRAFWTLKSLLPVYFRVGGKANANMTLPTLRDFRRLAICTTVVALLVAPARGGITYYPPGCFMAAKQNHVEDRKARSLVACWEQMNLGEHCGEGFHCMLDDQ
jgi:hypothetical protein